MKRASFYTLGCRLNQTESALMAHGLKEAGYEITLEKGGADLCVINTCTVTGQSDQKCKKSIRQIQRANPGAVICVVGCLSQMASDEILEIGGVDLVLGTTEKMKLAEYVVRFQKGDDPILAVGPIEKGEFSIDQASQQSLGLTRANLKIQDGCDFLCSFCIIPQARGRSRSRNLENLLAEARALIQDGVQELVLTGVNLGCFEAEGLDFIGLLDRLNEVPGLHRLRISSIEPTTVSAALFERMRDPNHALLPYLHLPLQSPTDRILELMRRRYRLHEFTDFIQQALAEVPGICIGSDILTGFPSETQAEFEEGLAILEQLPLHYFHVFPYSKREGARSAHLPEQNPAELAERVARLRELSDQKREAFTQNFVGQKLQVLFEDNGGGADWYGYSENFIRVRVNSLGNLKNQIKSVIIKGQEGALAIGQLLTTIEES